MYRRRIQPKKHIKWYRFKQPRSVKFLLFTKTIRHFIYGQKKLFTAPALVLKQKVIFLPAFLNYWWRPFRTALVDWMFSEWYVRLLKIRTRRSFLLTLYTFADLVYNARSQTFSFLTTRLFHPGTAFLFLKSYLEVECTNILKMNHYLRREAEMEDLVEEFFSPYRIFNVTAKTRKLFRAFIRNPMNLRPTGSHKTWWQLVQFMVLHFRHAQLLDSNCLDERFYLASFSWMSVNFMRAYQLQKKSLFNKKWWVNPRWFKHFYYFHKKKLQLVLNQWWKFMTAKTYISKQFYLAGPRRYLNHIRIFLGKLRLHLRPKFNVRLWRQISRSSASCRMLRLLEPWKPARGHTLSTLAKIIIFRYFVRSFGRHRSVGEVSPSEYTNLGRVLVARLKYSLYTLYEQQVHFWDSLHYYGMRRIWKPKAWFGNKRRYKDRTLHITDYKDWKSLNGHYNNDSGDAVWAPIILFIESRRLLWVRRYREIQLNYGKLPQHQFNGFMRRLRHPSSWNLIKAEKEKLYQRWHSYYWKRPTRQVIFLSRPSRPEKMGTGRAGVKK